MSSLSRTVLSSSLAVELIKEGWRSDPPDLFFKHILAPPSPTENPREVSVSSF